MWRAEELLRRGFFGSSPPCAEFLANCPDLLVISYAGYGFDWSPETGKFLPGRHGGLTREEMETVFFAVELGAAGM